MYLRHKLNTSNKDGKTTRTNLLPIQLILIYVPMFFLLLPAVLVAKAIGADSVGRVLDTPIARYCAIGLGVVLALFVTANLTPETVRPLARRLILPSTSRKLDLVKKDLHTTAWKGVAPKRIETLGKISSYVLLAVVAATPFVIYRDLINAPTVSSSGGISFASLIVLGLLAVFGILVTHLPRARMHSTKTAQQHKNGDNLP